MAVFTAINFLAVRLFARVNSAITWWKVAIPVLTIIILFFKFHAGNFSRRRRRVHPVRHEGRCSPPSPASSIVFSYLGFEQADQLAGEIKNPGRNLPRAIIIAVLPRHRDLHPAARSSFIGAVPPSLLTHGFQGIASTNPITIYPFAAVAGPGRARLLGDDPAHRRVRLPVRHRADLPDLHLAGRVRPGQEQVLPADLPVDRPERRPVVQPDHGVRVRPAVPAAVPELEVAGRPGHRRERAHVRGRPAVPGRVPQAACPRRTGPTGCPRRPSWPARLHHRPTC